MSLHDWAKAGWLRPHQTSRQQIADLFAIMDRDLEDASRDLSPGQVSAKEAAELAAFARELREDVIGWLEKCHSALSPWSR